MGKMIFTGVKTPMPIHGWETQADVEGPCGVLLLHNLSLVMPHIQFYEGTPHTALREINRLMERESSRRLTLNDNMSTNTLNFYLSEKRFAIQNFSSPVHDTQTVQDIFHSQQFDFMYLTSAEHYTAIVKADTQSSLLVDPRLRGPLEINDLEARSRIANSLGQDPITSQNRIIGVANYQNRLKFISSPARKLNIINY